MLLPLVFMLVQAVQVGWSELSDLLFRRLTAVLLWNTVSLAAVVTTASAVIGTAAAFATERTNLPGRRALSALIVLPVAVPDFVIAWGWTSLAPSLHGLWGASLVLSLGLYPLAPPPGGGQLQERGSRPGGGVQEQQGTVLVEGVAAGIVLADLALPARGSSGTRPPAAVGSPR